MTEPASMQRLNELLDGWQGYQQSIVAAVAPLSAEQLGFRPAPNLRSVGELVRHIALGRVTWFGRMHAPGSAEVAAQVDAWQRDDDGNLDVVEDALAITGDAAELVRWLETSWGMVEQTLASWQAEDLAVSYVHRWNAENWAVSRQWTLFRILLHDVHHGGELSLMLGLQGIEPFELGALGGHLVLPPRANPEPAP